MRGRLAELAGPVGPGPRLGIFLWSRAAIWAAALFAWLVFEPNRHPLRRPLGRPGAHPRPRLGDRRLGALGQRLVPADRRARLRRRLGCGRSLLPALPADPRRARTRPRRPLRRRRDRRLARRDARRVRAPLPAGGGRGSAPRARAGRSSTSRSSRWRSSSRRVYSESLFLALTRRRVPARRAQPLARRRSRDGPRDADAHRRRRAPARARRDGVAAAPTGRRALREPAASPRSSSPPTRSTSGSPAATRSPLRARRASGTGTSRTPARSAGSGTASAPAGRASQQLASGSHTHVLLDARCRTRTRCASPP